MRAGEASKTDEARADHRWRARFEGDEVRGLVNYAALVLARRDEVEARRGELDAQLALALASSDLDASLGGFAE